MANDAPIDFVISQDDDTGGDLLTAQDPRFEIHVLIASGERIGAYLGDGYGWADSDNAGRADAFGEQEVAYLSNITVSEAFRGQGLGAKVLKETLAWLDKRNVAATFLYAMPMGLRSMRYHALVEWYARHGFHRVSREGYEPPLVSNAMMRVNPRANRKRSRR